MIVGKALSPLVAAGLLVWTSAPGVAQVGAFGGYYSSGMDQFNYVLNRMQMQNILRKAEQRAGQGKAPPPPAAAGRPASTIVARAGAPVAPERLAAHYPAAHRAQAAQTFRQILNGYGQLETRLGLPAGDMAGAMAALIVGSWSVCRERDIIDGHFVAVARQLRGAIGQDPRFAQVALADRQLAYEQFAILGTELALLQMALRQKPDAAVQRRACEAGKGYLAQFGLDPMGIEIGAEGLVAAG